eukprot:SM000045S16199  [mRNA]  locus=s45:263590:264906:+ [translate_table: standard]
MASLRACRRPDASLPPLNPNSSNPEPSTPNRRGAQVEGADGRTTLALLPAKFRKLLWLKRGNYVIVDVGERERVEADGGKVTGTIMHVLYSDHVRWLQAAQLWPAAFASPPMPPVFLEEAGSQVDEQATLASHEPLNTSKAAEGQAAGTSRADASDTVQPQAVSCKRHSVTNGRCLSSTSDEHEKEGEDEVEEEDDEEDDLPPLEANCNRYRGPHSQLQNQESSSDSDEFG